MVVENDQLQIKEAFDESVKKESVFDELSNIYDNSASKLFEGEQLDDYHKNIYTILIRILDASLRTGAIDKLESDIKNVKLRYFKCNFASHAVIMKIQEAQYVLMCKYLEKNCIEKAKDMCEGFDESMETYIIERIKNKIPNVVEYENYYAAMLKIDISERMNIEVNKLKFWEGIYNVEHPESFYKLPKEWQSETSLVLKDKSLAKFYRSTYSYFGFIKFFKIRFDPRSDRYKMNLSDVQKLREYVLRPRVIKNIRIIFEEGIEDVHLDLNNVNENCEFSVKLPTTAKTIGGNLFRGSCNISYVDLSNTKIKSIDDATFFNSNLRRIKTPNTLKLIGKNAFANCKDLKDIDLSNTSVKKISRNAFYNSGIKKIKLSNELSTIDIEAFSKCKNLRKLDLTNTSISKVDSGFISDSGVETIKLPNSIDTISFSAFSDCNKLREVDLSNTKVKKIDSYAFFNSNIQNIKLPSTIRKIEYEAFANCKNLRKIDLSNTDLNEVAAYAFYGSGIREVNLPDDDVVIDQTAFVECNKLRK